MDLLEFNLHDQLELFIRVLIAATLGGIVGFEREMAKRPAGMRTHALLAAAACMLVGLADILVAHFAIHSFPDLLRADPVRVVEAIVTGTAFLGAGTIFRHTGTSHVEGLTTAASLLLVAGIGVAVAIGQLLLAGGVVVLALLLLGVARHFETRKDAGVPRGE
jgi:putative Mg2+ transporter-C (MgtC) family protein